MLCFLEIKGSEYVDHDCVPMTVNVADIRRIEVGANGYACLILSDGARPYIFTEYRYSYFIENLKAFQNVEVL